MSELKDIVWKGILGEYELADNNPTTLASDKLNTLHFQGKHANHILYAHSNNGLLNGQATIKDEKGNTIFILHFINNSICGHYEEFENGKKIREGSLEKSSREGKQRMYDEYGFLMYEGMYENDRCIENECVLSSGGVRYWCRYNNDRDTYDRMKLNGNEKEGLLFEVDLKNRPLRLRYMFGDGSSVLLRLYMDDYMLEYNSVGELCYEGGYSLNPFDEYCRAGVGKEYCDNDVLFSGSFERDLRNGYGNAFFPKSHSLLYCGEWRDGFVQGRGCLYNESGDVVFKGVWREGKGEKKEAGRETEGVSFMDVIRGYSGVCDALSRCLSFKQPGEPVHPLVDPSCVEKKERKQLTIYPESEVPLGKNVCLMRDMIAALKEKNVCCNLLDDGNVSGAGVSQQGDVPIVEEPKEPKESCPDTTTQPACVVNDAPVIEEPAATANTATQTAEPSVSPTVEEVETKPQNDDGGASPLHLSDLEINDEDLDASIDSFIATQVLQRTQSGEPPKEQSRSVSLPPQPPFLSATNYIPSFPSLSRARSGVDSVSTGTENANVAPSPFPSFEAAVSPQELGVSIAPQPSFPLTPVSDNPSFPLVSSVSDKPEGTKAPPRDAVVPTVVLPLPPASTPKPQTPGLAASVGSVSEHHSAHSSFVIHTDSAVDVTRIHLPIDATSSCEDSVTSPIPALPTPPVESVESSDQPVQPEQVTQLQQSQQLSQSVQSQQPQPLTPSVQLEQPTQPELPELPAQPEQPEESQQPELPAQPEQPEESQQPEQPEHSQQPEQQQPTLFFDETSQHYWKGAHDEHGLQGEGAILYRDQAPFQEGAFVNGQLSGQGKEYWPTDTVMETYQFMDEEPSLPCLHYEGEFGEGKLNGEGKEFGIDGDLCYEGEFKNGLYDGRGRLIDGMNEEVYEGDFKEGKRDGVGRVESLDGVLLREGEFADDVLSGNGEEYDAQGHLVARGQYENNLLNGTGEYYCFARNLLYDGAFKNGLFVHGVTRDLTTNRRIDEGDFEPFDASNPSLGYQLVKGKTYDENGMILMEGSFRNGRLNGYGKIYQNGVLASECVFKNGLCHGLLKQFYPHGGEMRRVGMVNNKMVGVCEEFSEEGKRVASITYDDGVEKRRTTYDAEGRVNFDGTVNGAEYTGQQFVYRRLPQELVCFMVALTANKPEPVMSVFSTFDLASAALDSRWVKVYEGGYVEQNGLFLRQGQGKAFLPDGRVIECEWTNNGIAPNTKAVVVAPAPDAAHPKRKPGRYYGFVVFDSSQSEQNPSFFYHGEGVFIYTDDSYFQGVWDQNRLVSYQPICWKSGALKYQGAIVQFSIDDANVPHEFLPSGIVQYFPLDRPLSIQGTFWPDYNCIGNPIRLIAPNGQVLCEATNANYSMCADNYNVNYGY